jgi:hypothetical protein
MRFDVVDVRTIKIGAGGAWQLSTTNRIPDFRTTIFLLSQQPWATNLEQIPATVIDKGILRNVPYISFRCGTDYEVNVYGDLDHPAGIEVGVYRKLIEDRSARANCLGFVASLLRDADEETLRGLGMQQGLKARNGLTFEITPPTAEDAYNGWWVSVYDEVRLNSSRASEKELGQISVPKVAALREKAADASADVWSAKELALARPSTSDRITFTTRSGTVFSNAEVVRVVDGVSLMYREGPLSMGTVRLEDLPKDLQQKYGYDPAKTAAADEAAKAQKVHDLQAQAQLVDAASPASVNAPSTSSSGYSPSSPSYSGGDRVYVRSYTRKDGTFVQAHTRSYPHSR